MFAREILLTPDSCNIPPNPYNYAPIEIISYAYGGIYALALLIALHFSVIFFDRALALNRFWENTHKHTRTPPHTHTQTHTYKHTLE